MIQQVSDAELQLVKIIWAKVGTALYAEIMENVCFPMELCGISPKEALCSLAHEKDIALSL